MLDTTLVRAILLGLEVLIIADIVQTITIEPTAESALVLGVIVLVRTFLSFSLEIELEGVVPWRRAIATVDHPSRVVRVILWPAMIEALRPTPRTPRPAGGRSC